MSKILHTKLIGVAIAIAFLGMAFSGLSGLGSNDSLKVDVNMIDLSMESRSVVDMSKIRDCPSPRIIDLGDDVVTLNSEPGEGVKTTPFIDGFETYTPQLPPDDPPWASSAENGSEGDWEYFFETETVGNVPDPAVWDTVSGASNTVYWSRNMEDTTVGQDLANAYWAGFDGYYGTMAGGTITAETPPAGAPPGQVWPGITLDTLAAEYTGGGAAEYWGPAGISSPDADHLVATAWFNHATTDQFNLIFYDGAVGAGAELVFFGGDIIHFPGGAQTTIAGINYAADEWHEIGVEYDDSTETYSVWWDGAEYVAGSAYSNAGANINDMIFYSGGTADCVIDNVYAGIPATGTTEVIEVTNTWASSQDGGVQSVFMDQNNEATVASTQAAWAPPYMFGDEFWTWFEVKTDTVANSDGAIIYTVDYMGNYNAGIRFNGGNIEHYTAGSWAVVMPYAADTVYFFEFTMNDGAQEITELYINSVLYVSNVPYGETGAGLNGFRIEGTPGTQSTIWADVFGAYSDPIPGVLEVDDTVAHTGTQSVHMWERGAIDSSYLGTGIAEGVGVTYGEFSFWFYTGDPQGGASFYIFDSTGSNLMTVVSMGADIGVGINPGNVDWVDGGFIAPGPAFAPHTWNNITIRYDCIAQTFDAVWNGVVQGTYAFFNPAIDLTYVEFYGGAIDAPADFYFDDMYLWIDDPPATPLNLHVDMPAALPSIENNYTVDQDNAVEGAVTNTYTNIDEIVLPHDGLTEDIQEVLITGGAAPITDRANSDYIDPADGEGTVTGGSLANVNDGDNDQYYAIMETVAGGGPNARSVLGWIFEVPVTGGTDVEFFVQAYHDLDVLDGDDYNFDYSTASNGGPWTPMVTVTDTTDPGTYQSFSDATLDAFSGTLWIRVQDTDRTNGNDNVFSNIYIDDMYVVSATAAPDYMGLEHRWRTENVPAGSTTLELQVTAATSAAPDDTFSFGYSTVLGGPYTSVLTVNSAVMGTYTAGIPIALNGQFYINVVDDSMADPAQADSIIIEAITIYWQQVSGGASSTQIATADNPVDGGVVGTFALTNPPADAPPDGNAQQFTEVDASSAPHEPIEFAPGPGPEPKAVIAGPYDMTGGIPAGWTEYDAGGSVSANTWVPVDCAASGLPLPTMGDVNALWVNWETPYNNRALETEAYDFSANQNVMMDFDHFMSGTWGDWLYLEYSTDGGGAGGTWNGITSWNADGSSTDWNQRLGIDCSAVDLTSNVRFRFRYEAADGNSNGVDYVTINGDLAGTTMEHVWTMEDVPTSALTRDLSVTARFNTGSDDNFQFGWSQNVGGPFWPLAGVIVNSDTYTTYTDSISTAFDGPIYINVVDSSGSDSTYDTLYVDDIHIDSTASAGNTSVNIIWDLSADDGGGQNDVTMYNVYYSDAETGGTFAGGPYNFLASVPAGTHYYEHFAEYDDFDNNVWYVVTAEDTHQTQSIPTGYASKFNVAPEPQNLLVDGATEVLVTPGAIVNLAADIYDDSSTWEDIPKTDGAEWFDGFTGDPGEGAGTAMAGDGAWDTVSEHVTSTVDTTAWGYSESHFIYVRGHEVGPGNTGTGWGVPVGVWVNTTAAPVCYDIPIPGAAVAGDWVFVSFPYPMSGAIEVVLDDSVFGGGGTAWDIAKWYNPLDTADPWKTHHVGSTANDLTTIDNMMGVWIHLTATDGILSTSTVGDYSVAAVNINLYAGWNLVSYPSVTPSQADLTLPVEADMVAYYDDAAPYLITDDPTLAITLVEGNAYWVHVTADTLWSVAP